MCVFVRVHVRVCESACASVPALICSDSWDWESLVCPLGSGRDIG